MSQVEFKASLVNAHGYPQACLTCGNDEDDQLVCRKVSRTSPESFGCALLCIPFGPVVWLIGGLVYWAVNRSSLTSKIRVPVCNLCNQAAYQAGLRGAAIMVAAGILVMLDSFTLTPPLDVWMGFAGILLGGYALVEYSWLSRPFKVRVRKATTESILVEIDNDDYPGLYQRHVDNALLYGSSDSVGARD